MNVGTRSAAAPDGASGVRVLTDEDLPEALDLCAVDPVSSVLATTRIEAATHDSLARSGGQVWGFPAQGPLEALCWSGANLVPVMPTAAPEALDAFARRAMMQGRRCSSIVGVAESALGLWSRLEPIWPAAREVRPNQPSMMIDSDPLIEPDPRVRYSEMTDFPVLLPACVRMFLEEVGYSPMEYSASAYEERVRSLITGRRSFVRIETEDGRSVDADGVRGLDRAPEVVFKAEIGAASRGVAQVQGVWVAPHHRGHGYSEAGMAAVVAGTRRDIAPVVSLYVNDYNGRALAAYRRVGFEQVGTFATVLF